jgi:hypothetical protein
MSQYFDNKDSFLQPKVNQYGSHMVMTNVHKETKKKFWNIDSRFRDDYEQYAQTVSGSQINWYTFTLPQSINDVKSISVCNAEIPISFYNISNAFGNNVMKINNSIVTIPDGTYTAASLKTALQTQLTSISPAINATFDVSYNGNNTTFFKNTNGSAVSINFAVKSSNTCNGVTNPPSGNTADFDKYNIKSKLGWLLGFRDISYSIPNGTTKYSESSLDMNNPKYLYLVMDEFINGNPNSFISPFPMSIINKNILAKISLDNVHYGIGTVLPANQYNGLLLSDKRTYSGKVNLQKLKIQLVNEYGYPVNLNGLDFSFCIEIEYE